MHFKVTLSTLSIMFLSLTIPILFINILHCSGKYFNYKNVTVLQPPEAADIYFGYSVLLLRRTEVPTIIVGAPKQKNNSLIGGSLYKCEINNANCERLSIISGFSYNSVIGNWFGSNVMEEDVDVDETNVFSCAPREIKPEGSYYMAKGQCYKININDESQDRLLASVSESFGTDNRDLPYYKAAYGQAGFDFQFLPNSHDSLEYDLIFGAPGYNQWNGAVIIHTFHDEVRYIQENTNVDLKHQYYLGYSVLGEKSNKFENQFTIIAGAPRYNDLQGAVFIFESTSSKTVLTKTIHGPDQIGSYFGSALLSVDVDGDTYKDLFIAAPMDSGKTWDEGAVFYYRTDKRSNDLDVGKKLTGTIGKFGARFGTTMVTLGDINLDGFNDIAISAPYEDDTGAVYVFMGSKNGPMLVEIILPKQFQPDSTIRGFGLGLSNGKDVDNNGHNDLAIGAFKSDKMFIFKTKSIVNCTVELIVQSTLDIYTKTLPIEYCIRMTWKNGNQNPNRILKFNTTWYIDERGKTNDQIQSILTLSPNKLLCKNLSVTIDDQMNYEDFVIKLNVEQLNENVLTEGVMTVERKIPFVLNCGRKMCFPKLSLKAHSETPNLILGLTKELKVEIELENSGDVAYHCYLDIRVSKGIGLRNNKNCEKLKTSYHCFVSIAFINSKKLIFTFDINNFVFGATNVNLQFLIQSDGVFNEPLAPINVYIPILAITKPYIEGISVPQGLDYPIKSNQTEIKHTFNIANLGPTPFSLNNVYIFIPDLIDAHVEAVLKINQEESMCALKIGEIQEIFNFSVSEKVQHFEQDVFNIDCSSRKCFQILCNNNYFLPKTETASYTIRFMLDLNNFVDSLKLEKNTLGLTSTAFVTNNHSTTETITTHATTLIYISKYTKSIPIWIYIVSSVGGIIILAVLIFVMYKMNFFSRLYKRKIEEEKLIENHNCSPTGELE